MIQKKLGLFLKLQNREAAIKATRDSADGVLFVAVIQTGIGFLFDSSIIIDATILAILAAILRMWKSRLAAILLLLMFFVIVATCILAKFSIAKSSGLYICFNLIVLWGGLRAIQATFLLHGRFAEPKGNVAEGSARIIPLSTLTNMNIPVHDHFLVSYEVLCEQRKIQLHTEYRDKGKPFVQTDVIFSGVSAYHFWQDCFCNVIFSIEETMPEIIYRNHRAEFEAGQRYGWPGKWGKTEETALAYFREHGVRGFTLQSSFGMDGWILANKIEVRRIERSTTTAERKTDEP